MAIAIILFLLATGVLLSGLYWFFQPGKKQGDYYKNERLYSDAWNRISGEKPRTDNGSKSLNRSSRSSNNSYKDSSDNFLSDLILRTFRSRRSYYRMVYLKSNAWQRKRYLVLKRDNWCCVHCGRRATQVHHKKYARKIGKEPIEWLESVCNACHNDLHR